MSDLMEFLKARLADDTEWATTVLDDPKAWNLHGTARRFLAEAEAKRRILDDVLPTMKADELQIAGEWGVGSDPSREASDDLLSLLALPYANHPDYRAEWRAGEDPS